MKNLKKLFVSLFYTAAIIFAASPELFARGAGNKNGTNGPLGKSGHAGSAQNCRHSHVPVAKSLYDTLLEPEFREIWSLPGRTMGVPGWRQNPYLLSSKRGKIS